MTTFQSNLDIIAKRAWEKLRINWERGHTCLYVSVKVALVGAVVITEGTSERLLFLMDTRDVVLHSYPLSKALLDQIQIQIIN